LTVTSVDTNILFAALIASSTGHVEARAFLSAQSGNADFVIPELVLVELYVLLRNPAVVSRPIGASDAVDLVSTFRRHPRWRHVDHDPAVMDDVWRAARDPDSARSRIFDHRLAFGLLRHGVTEFATRNVRHFQGLGFSRVYDPLA
jgi:toxin-antitoxin system PIN domain toxin